MMQTSFIIPSAGLSRRLFPLSASTPKLLVRLNGVPIFSLLYQQAIRNKCVNVIIAISQEFERQLKEFIADNYANAPLPIIVKVVDNPSAGVLYSVTSALKAEECKENALVVLSDTLYTGEFPVCDSYVIYKEVPEPVSRWCLVDTYSITDKTDFVNSFHDKPIEPVTTNKALIGVYRFNTSIFLRAANKVIEAGVKLRGEFQLSQALSLYNEKTAIEAVKAEEGKWFDTGTLATLREASNDFFLSRCFNHIRIKNGKLIKSSSKKDVIQKQYLWYQNFKQKDLIPTIYDYKETLNSAEIEMELCAMPDLGTYFNYCTAEPVFFEQTIQFILDTMKKRVWGKPLVCDINSKASQANKDMLWDKTLTRLDQIDIEIPLNIQTMIMETEEKYLSRSYEIPLTVPIHGDFILSNILFEPQRMMFKLIDPRGSYGNSGMWGELRYELAKLLHSVSRVGKYEAIIHNLYEIVDDKVIYYMSEKKAKCFEAAEEEIYRFAQQYDIYYKELKAIEAMLYLSMIPLHKESPDHQKAFYLIAVQLLEEVCQR